MKIGNKEYYMVPCPHCWKDILIIEDRIGSKIKCIHCKVNFRWISETEIDPITPINMEKWEENWKDRETKLSSKINKGDKNIQK